MLRTRPPCVLSLLLLSLGSARGFQLQRLPQATRLHRGLQGLERPAPAAFAAAPTKARASGVAVYAGEGGGGLRTVGAVALLAAVLGASILPLVQTTNVMSKVEVVQNQDGTPGQLSVRPKYARLSPLAINKKLAQIPVFFVADAATGAPVLEGGQRGIFYLDPADAEAAAKGKGGGIKAATLDEVYFPLVTKRGVFGYRSPLVDKANAEASYTVQPTKAALAAASSLGKSASDGVDVPIFQADKLAFQAQDGRGVVIPIFLNSDDLDVSWERLRGSSGGVAAKPTVTANDLSAVLDAMQGGSQDFAKMEFFPSMPALERARDLLEQQQ